MLTPIWEGGSTYLLVFYFTVHPETIHSPSLFVMLQPYSQNAFQFIFFLNILHTIPYIDNMRKGCGFVLQRYKKKNTINTIYIYKFSQQVWATQGHSQSSPEATPCYFGCVLGVVVLLEDETSPQNAP